MIAIRFIALTFLLSLSMAADIAVAQVQVPPPIPGAATDGNDGQDKPRVLDSKSSVRRNTHHQSLEEANVVHVGVVNDSMTLERQIAQVYQQNIDVDPAIDLRKMLRELTPRSLEKIDQLFERRVGSRKEDEPLISKSSVSKQEISKIVRSCQEKEDVRSKRLSQELSAILTVQERRQLIQLLVQRGSTRALTFSLVSMHFGVSDEASKKIKSDWLGVRLAIAKAMSSGKLPHQIRAGQRAYASALMHLTKEKLAEFWTMQGQLKEGEPLDTALRRFPLGDRALVDELIGLKLAE